MPLGAGNLGVQTPGASGEIRVDEEAVEVRIKLSFLLKPMESKIKDAVVEHLEEALNGQQ